MIRSTHWQNTDHEFTQWFILRVGAMETENSADTVQYWTEAQYITAEESATILKLVQLHRTPVESVLIHVPPWCWYGASATLQAPKANPELQYRLHRRDLQDNKIFLQDTKIFYFHVIHKVFSKEGLTEYWNSKFHPRERKKSCSGTLFNGAWRTVTEIVLEKKSH